MSVVRFVLVIILLHLCLCSINGGNFRSEEEEDTTYSSSTELPTTLPPSLSPSFDPTYSPTHSPSINDDVDDDDVDDDKSHDDADDGYIGDDAVVALASIDDTTVVNQFDDLYVSIVLPTGSFWGVS